MTITTCQICARPIKANTGVIAHHGYKRPGNGWQSSSCAGARYKPYEESCDRIPPVIQQIEDFIVGRQTWLVEFENNPPATLTYQQYTGFGQYKPVEVPKPDDFHPVMASGRSIPHTYSDLFFGKRADVQRQIDSAITDQGVLKQRLANWKPLNAP